MTLIYLKSLLSKDILFFPAFLLLSSTIINKAEISGILTKSLKNISIETPLSFYSFTWLFRKVEPFISSSESGKGIHIFETNSKGGNGCILFNSSAAS